MRVCPRVPQKEQMGPNISSLNSLCEEQSNLMRRTDSDKSMETVHLSEDPGNEYEEITVQLRAPSKEVISRKSRRCQLAGVVFCVAAATAIFIAIVVELVNAFKDNPYL